MDVKHKLLLSIVLITGVILFTYGVAKWPMSLDPLLHLSGIASTVYADEFTLAGFHQITFGMSRTDVERLIGRGFRTFTSYPCHEEGTVEQSIWYYSINGDGSDNHWRYWVSFDEKDTVEQIRQEFWWD
jgi:hypothetical protein